MSASKHVARRDLLKWGAGWGVAAAYLPGVAGAAQDDLPATTSVPTNPPRFERFKIGSIEGIVLSDGNAELNPIQPTFAADAAPGELHAALDRAFHPRDRARLAFTPVLFRIGSDVVLVDTGTGAPPGQPLGHLVSNLRSAGVKPEDVTAVIITHAHSDHIGGLGSNAAPTFPNAMILLSKSELEFWTSDNPDLSRSLLPENARAGMASAAKKQLDDLAPRIERFDVGAKLFPGIEILDTSGHTPGHVSLLVADGSESLCVLGDVAHNHVIMFANPGWKMAFDVDPVAGAATRARFFDRLAADRTRVLGYHLPWPGFGHIRRLGPGNGAAGAGYEWVIDPLV